MKRALPLIVACLTLAPFGQAQGKFSVPASRAASATAVEATQALAAGDLAQAAASLGELLDSEPGTLIEINPRAPGEPPADSDAWVGAASWARAQLAGAPPALAERLAKQREATAAGALAAALSGNVAVSTARRRRALERIGQLYPGTRPALEADVLLGDLAFEAGHSDRAAAAWRAAVATASPKLRAALEHRLTQLEPQPRSNSSAPSYPPLLEGFWSYELPELPGENRYIDDWNLWPVAQDGLVWINTGLSVLAIEVASGRLAWDSGEPAGWQQLSDWSRRELARGVGREDLINRVATDGRVVVAAQQLPFTENENDQIEGHTITVGLPERRLFAFDARSGAPLWNHTPDPLDRLTGAPLPFAERARISAPPLIVGDLVCVPSYELVGRINLHVSAYDLFTGEPVWDRLVVSGQTRVNLFGEHEVEFNSAPLAVAGEDLIVATGLGVVASLDLSSGEPHWCQDYSRFELPKTNGYYTPRTTRRWNNAAPVVAGGSVFVAPADSPDLIQIELASGHLELEANGYDLEDRASRGLPEQVQLDHLVDVDELGPWLGGDQLVAFTFDPNGRLQLRFPPIPTQSGLSTYSGPSPRPRALVVGSGGPLLIATDDGAFAIDRKTGKATDLGPRELDDWAPGNLALESGRLLVLGDNRLAGWVNWDAVIGEGLAALALDPEGPHANDQRIGLAQAYLSRAAAGATPAGDLERARALLFGSASEPALAASPDPRVIGLRFQLLESEGRALAGADDPRAFERLHTALELEPHEVIPVADQLAVILSAFEVLGVPDAELPETGWRATARQSLFEILAGRLAREVVPEGLVLARFDPSLASLPDELGPLVLTRVPVGYFAELARAASELRAGRAADALASLHTALFEYGELSIAGGTGKRSLGPVVEARIAAVLETSKGRAAYATFEAAAAQQLARANEAPAEVRASLITGVLNRWPHSQAAGRAREALLEAELVRLELELSDLSDLAAAARPLTQRQDTARVRAFQALARGAAATGNLELAELFTARLLARDPAPTEALPPGERRNFRGPLQAADGLASVRLGGFLPLFPIDIGAPSDDLGGELLLVAGTSGDILAFEGDGGGRISWSFPGGGYSSAPWLQRAVALPAGPAKVVAVIATGGLAGIDPKTGFLEWSRGPGSQRPLSLVGEGGLLCVEWTSANGQRTIEGLDAFGGALLWSYSVPPDLEDGVDGLRMLLSGTRLVLLGRGRDTGAVVLDATTGFPLGELALAKGASSGDREATWARGSKLCVPRLLAGTGGRANVLDVFDLERLFEDTATPPSFTISLGRGQETAGVVHSPGGDFLWMIGVGPSRESSSGDALFEVDAELGALRKVARLNTGERPLGLELGGTLKLDAEMLLVAGSPGSAGEHGNLTVRGIALPLGPLWSVTITAPTDPRWSLFDGPMPSAVLGRNAVAFIYALSGVHASMGQELHLLVLDRRSGAIQENRVLVSRLGRMSGIALDGVGAELFVFGRGAAAGRGRMEVMESRNR